jgi:hypothetical protein
MMRRAGFGSVSFSALTWFMNNWTENTVTGVQLSMTKEMV